ncbi:ketoacyl-synthetase C-terminal extension domain-containing protein [Bacillus velezensis]|nr:ketoacyl-synthetase C-terminal extension domain-containing protein [Bacillus velezensis]
MLNHKKNPPLAHFNEPNPLIHFHSSPFYVNQEAAAFTSGDEPSRGGVSSFGFSGTNAHVVLEEYISQSEYAPDEHGPTYLFYPLILKNHSMNSHSSTGNMYRMTAKLH